MRQMPVSAIENGTVIDHIDSDSTFEVAEILNIRNEPEIVLLAANLPSSALGKKGLIKISGKRLTEEEVDKIALIAPDATINIIEKFELVKKFKVKIPDVIESFVKCFNPKCITNHQNVPTRFYTATKSPLKLRCHYCERCMTSRDVKLV